MNEEREKKYRKEFDDYRIQSRQKKEIEDKLDKIKERVAAMLHEDKINTVSTNLDIGEQWTALYQPRVTNSTDLKLLMETVGSKKYSEIVTPKESTSLYIKKAGKEKKSSLTNEMPVNDPSAKLNIPDGTILS